MAGFDSYLQAIHRFRSGLILLTVAATAVAGVGLARLEISQDDRFLFGPDSPEVAELDRFEASYGRLATAVFLVSRRNGGDLDRPALEALIDISRTSRAVRNVTFVDSVVDTPVLRPADQSRQGLVSLVDAQRSENFAELQRLIKDDPGRFPALLSRDGEFAVVQATLKTPPDDAAAVNDAAERFLALKDQFVARYPNLRIFATGTALNHKLAGDATRDDVARQLPFMILAMVIFLIASFRSVTATLALAAVLASATVITMGVAGWYGLVLNSVTASAPMILLGLGIATCVHIIMTWQQEFHDGNPRDLALLKSVRANLKPVSLALLTTVISFLCLNFSDSPPFQQFGNLVAIGLTVTLVLGFTLLPALLTIIPTGTVLGRQAIEKLLIGLGAWVVKGRRVLLLATVAATIVGAYGVSLISFDDRFSKYFDERFELRRALDIFENNISGVFILEFSLPSPRGRVAIRPYLEDVARFSTWIKSQDQVTHVFSVLDLFERAAANQPNLLDQNGVPRSTEAARQLYDAIRGSDQATRLEQYVGPEEKQSRVTVLVRGASSTELLDLAELAKERLREFEPAVNGVATGNALITASLSRRNITSMVVGTTIALVIISGLMVFVLGRLSHGAISLIPNLIPLLIAYGLWGLVYGDVSFAGTMVCAMTFGLVVDDTVHYLAKYKFYRTVRLIDPQASTIESFRTVGFAIVVTTFAISIGFFALSFSGFLVNQHLGLLTVMTLLAALVADLLFLPPLLLLTERGRIGGDQSESIEQILARFAKGGYDATAGASIRLKKPSGATAYGWLQNVDRPRDFVPISASTVTVGRRSDNDVILRDLTVHRVHAVIHAGTEPGEVMITDLSDEGGNGVWVNGAKIAATARIYHNDLIELGAVRLRFYNPDAVEPRAAPELARSV